MKNRFNRLAYKDMVQKEVLSETFSRLYKEAIGYDDSTIARILSESAIEQFQSTLSFNTEPATLIMRKLNESGIEFVRKMNILAESVAEKKCEDASEAGIEEMPHKVEFNEVEKALIDSVFTDHAPDEAIEKIRDSVANALYSENMRADELRKASELVREQNTDQNAINESVKLMSSKAPSSLMGAILTSVSHLIVNENATLIEQGATVGHIMADKKDEIKTLAMGTYAIYETMNTFGYKHYTKDEVEALIDDIALQ